MHYEDHVAPADIQTLSLILRAHHPLLVLETRDGELALATLRRTARELNMPILEWLSGTGLVRRSDTTTVQQPIELEPLRRMGGSFAAHEPAVAKEGKLRDALSFIEANAAEALYVFPDLGDDLREPVVKEALRRIASRLFENRSAVVFVAPKLDLPDDLEHLTTPVKLEPFTEERYRAFLQGVLVDVRKHSRVEVELSGEELKRMLDAARGLALDELRRIASVAMVRDGRLSIQDLALIEQAKQDWLVRTGCLERATTDVHEHDVAGLAQLKQWLRERSVAFRDPERAQRFGLTMPRGLLLMGVQGCGKSLSAKLCASMWQVPLVRFDPAALFHKYVGETEKSLRRTLRLAEELSPLILWVDELDKAFSTGDASDGGVSKRVLGTFLSWLSEHRSRVFVVATANNIEALPAELLRKGRFDELFFLDLPTAEEREALLRLHLARRGRTPELYDLTAIVRGTEGFSGGEVEQLVQSALFSAFGRDRDLTTEDLAEQSRRTVPLSVTMAESVARLRVWATARAVNASG